MNQRPRNRLPVIAAVLLLASLGAGIKSISDRVRHDVTDFQLPARVGITEHEGVATVTAFQTSDGTVLSPAVPEGSAVTTTAEYCLLLGRYGNSATLGPRAEIQFVGSLQPATPVDLPTGPRLTDGCSISNFVWRLPEEIAGVEAEEPSQLFLAVDITTTGPHPNDRLTSEPFWIVPDRASGSWGTGTVPTGAQFSGRIPDFADGIELPYVRWLVASLAFGVLGVAVGGTAVRRRLRRLRHEAALQQQRRLEVEDLVRTISTELNAEVTGVGHAVDDLEDDGVDVSHVGSAHQRVERARDYLSALAALSSDYRVSPRTLSAGQLVPLSPEIPVHAHTENPLEGADQLLATTLLWLYVRQAHSEGSESLDITVDGRRLTIRYRPDDRSAVGPAPGPAQRSIERIVAAHGATMESAVVRGQIVVELTLPAVPGDTGEPLMVSDTIPVGRGLDHRLATGSIAGPAGGYRRGR